MLCCIVRVMFASPARSVLALFPQAATRAAIISCSVCICFGLCCLLCSVWFVARVFLSPCVCQFAWRTAQSLRIVACGSVCGKRSHIQNKACSMCLSHIYRIHNLYVALRCHNTVIGSLLQTLANKASNGGLQCARSVAARHQTELLKKTILSFS